MTSLVTFRLVHAREMLVSTAAVIVSSFPLQAVNWWPKNTDSYFYSVIPRICVVLLQFQPPQNDTYTA